MEELQTGERRVEARITSHGTCDECGKIDVLTARLDPESPISGTVRLCPACADAPEPFWHDER